MKSVGCDADSIEFSWLTLQKKYASKTPVLSQSCLLMDVQLLLFSV